jgi:hypothetical protein
MITRHEDSKTDIWSKLAAELPDSAIAWRQDGKPMHRDGKYFARFVCYVEAGTVRDRLDAVVPGEWDVTLFELPDVGDDDGQVQKSVKARLQILGCIREGIGQGRDWKAAETDAFKRAAVRFGIGHELYTYEQNWVQVESDSKYAKPLEDPQTAYTRRYGGASPKQAAKAPAREATQADVERTFDAAPVEAPPRQARAAPKPAPAATIPTQQGDDAPACPKCEGRMWDNRATKRNPKAPDFKCRDKSCDGVIWPPKAGAGKREQMAPLGPTDDDFADFPAALEDEADSLPF